MEIKTVPSIEGEFREMNYLSTRIAINYMAHIKLVANVMSFGKVKISHIEKTL